MKNDIVMFKNGELELEVNVTPEKETVWLTQDQMSSLFDTARSSIAYHINNIFKEGELQRDTSVEIFDRSQGKASRPPMYYNLDVIISVGYRVKSQRGIAFRKWATSILKDYMIKGYAINEKRLEILNKTIDIQTKMLATAYELDEKELLDVIEAYQNTLSLLDDYDHGSFSKPEEKETMVKLVMNFLSKQKNQKRYSYADICAKLKAQSLIGLCFLSIAYLAAVFGTGMQ